MAYVATPSLPGGGLRMANLRRVRERTISFFEVVQSEQAAQTRINPLPWEEMLAALSTAELSSRTWDGVDRQIGNTATYAEQDHLLLHRVKEQGEWFSSVNWETGEWEELEDFASRGYLDTSVYSFLPFGNIVASMRGSTSSPSHKGLEEWLNGLKFFPDHRLVVRPLMTQAEVHRLQSAQGASRIEIKVGTNSSNALANRQGRLARTLHNISETYGDANVTMIISIPRGGGNDPQRQELLSDLQDLGEALPSVAERAAATLLYGIEGDERRQIAEFVEHKITAKRRVPAVNDEGESVKISAAVAAMIDVAAEHEEELRIAVDEKHD